MQNVSDFCRELLPIIGVVTLIVLIIALIKIIAFIGSVQQTVVKTHGSIEKVEEALSKAQAPLDTVVKVAKGVDGAYDTSSKAFEDAKNYVVKNIYDIKEKIKDILNKSSFKEEAKELSSDDILDKGE